jgi:hypothetical protein
MASLAQTYSFAWAVAPTLQIGPPFAWTWPLSFTDLVLSKPAVPLDCTFMTAVPFGTCDLSAGKLCGFKGFDTRIFCVVFSPTGGKKVFSSLGKRSNLYDRSMTLDFAEHKH